MQWRLQPYVMEAVTVCNLPQHEVSVGKEAWLLSVSQTQWNRPTSEAASSSRGGRGWGPGGWGLTLGVPRCPEPPGAP